MARHLLLPVVALAAVIAVMIAGLVGAVLLDAQNAAGPGEFGVPVDKATPSNLRADERVVFFPTVARLSDDGARWVVPIHACVYEPEEHGSLRTATLRLLGGALDLDDNADAAAKAIFDRRVRLFMVDNERNKRLTLRIGDRAFELDAMTGAEGHVNTTIELPAAMSGRVEYTALLPRGDQRTFTGVSHLLAPDGLTVISDIDDTVKVSHVLDKKKLLRATFYEDFEPAPGMPDRYAAWAKDGAAIIYVSSGPWQLQPELAAGLTDAGFPEAAAFDMRIFRLKDSRALDLLADPYDSKLARIEAIITAHPHRRYILVGDTGEKDPEVYGQIARTHPDRVEHIHLRNVTGDTLAAARLKAALRDVPPDRVTLIPPD